MLQNKQVNYTCMVSVAAIDVYIYSVSKDQIKYTVVFLVSVPEALVLFFII
jgi:hypothetical protein